MNPEQNWLRPGCRQDIVIFFGGGWGGVGYIPITGQIHGRAKAATTDGEETDASYPILSRVKLGGPLSNEMH